jgi:hypothetical protein
MSDQPPELDEASMHGVLLYAKGIVQCLGCGELIPWEVRPRRAPTLESPEVEAEPELWQIAMPLGEYVVRRDDARLVCKKCSSDATAKMRAEGVESPGARVTIDLDILVGHEVGDSLEDSPDGLEGAGPLAIDASHPFEGDNGGVPPAPVDDVRE